MAIILSRSLCTVCAVAAAVIVPACLLVDPVEKPSQAASGGGTGSGGNAGTGATAGTAGAGECSTNLDCFRNSGTDAPSRCRSDGRCVELRTADCPVVLTPGGNPSPSAGAAYNEDDALFVGAYSRNPSLASVRPEDATITWNYQLALDEISGEDRGGLPDPQSPSSRRPVVVVVCNNDDQRAQDDPEMILRGFKHLVDEVEVPAVVAALLPDDMLDVLEYGVPKNVFLISPQGATTSVAGFDDSDLAWHMLGQPAEMAPVYAEVLKHAETYLQDRAEPRRPSVLKIATVSTSDAFDTDLQLAVQPNLLFNGKTAAANLADGNLRAFTVSAGTLGLDVAAIMDYSPHVIISFAGGVFTERPGIMHEVERLWLSPEFNPGLPHPLYILSPVNQSGFANVEAMIGESTDVFLDDTTHERFVGVSAAPPQDRSLYEDYLFRLRLAHERALAETENYYDAMFYLLYSMYAGGNFDGINGQNIVSGMFRLTRGSEPHDIGPEDRLAVFSALDVPGKNIRLNGTLGPPRFDNTGVRIDDVSVFCFDEVPRQLNHALRYDRTNQVLVETTPCAFFTSP